MAELENFEVRSRRPGSPVESHTGGTRLVAAVKPPPRAAVDAMLAATGSAELSREQFQAMMRTLAKDGASRLAATVSVALVCPCVELKSSNRLAHVFDGFDASFSAVLRGLDESNRFVQKSAESTSI